MKYTLCLLVGAVSTLSMMGCPPVPSDFQVVYPAANETESYHWDTEDGKLLLFVEFSEDIDLSSFVAGENIILESDIYDSVNIMLTLDNDDALRIKTLGNYEDVLLFNPNAHFTLHLQQQGPAIKALSGKELDADGDGYAGGKWQTSYVFEM